MGSFRTKQHAVELHENPADQANAEPRHPAQDPTRKVLASPIRSHVHQRECRTDAGTAVDDLEPGTREQCAMSRESEILEVVWIPVKRLQERRRGENVPSGPQYPEHLGDSALGLLQVLQDRFAVDHADTGRSHRETVRVSDDVDVWKGREVQVHEARVDAQWTASDRDRGTSAFAGRNAEGFAGPVTPGRIDFAEATGERSRAPVLP